MISASFHDVGRDVAGDNTLSELYHGAFLQHHLPQSRINKRTRDCRNSSDIRDDCFLWASHPTILRRLDVSFCPQCGVDNPASARYCDQCGAMLIPVSSTPAAPSAPSPTVPSNAPLV